MDVEAVLLGGRDEQPDPRGRALPQARVPVILVETGPAPPGGDTDVIRDFAAPNVGFAFDVDVDNGGIGGLPENTSTASSNWTAPTHPWL